MEQTGVRNPPPPPQNSTTPLSIVMGFSDGGELGSMYTKGKWSLADLSWLNAKKTTNANDNFAPEMALAA